MALAIIDSSGTGREMSELRLPFRGGGARLRDVDKADWLVLGDIGVDGLSSLAITAIEKHRRGLNCDSLIGRLQATHQHLQRLKAAGSKSVSQLLRNSWPSRRIARLSLLPLPSASSISHIVSFLFAGSIS